MSGCRWFRAAYWRKCAQVHGKRQISHSRAHRLHGSGRSVSLHWGGVRCAGSTEQKTDSDCDAQHAKSHCPGQNRMSLRPCGNAPPRESRVRLPLGLQLSQQLRVAPETRRASCQVLCDSGLTFGRTERERSQSSVRGASLAVRVRKGLRKIGMRKVEQVFVLFLEGSAVFHSHSNFPEPLTSSVAKFINHSSDQVSP